MSPQRFNQAARFWDRLARYAITTGGILIIISVIGILVMIARVAAPLFQTPAPRPVGPAQALPESGHAVAVGSDEYAGTIHLLSPEGALEFLKLDGTPLKRLNLDARQTTGATIRAATPIGGQQYSLLWSDGAQTIESVRVGRRLDAEGREVFTPTVSRVAQFPPEPGSVAPRLSLARGAENAFVRASIFPDGRIRLTRLTITEDFSGEKQTEVKDTLLQDALPAPLSALALDQAGHFLYAGSEKGDLLRWDLRPETPLMLDQVRAFDDQRAITALAMVFGDTSLAVGDARGGLSTWFAVRTSARGNHTELKKIHTLQTHKSAVARIVASQKHKSLLSVGSEGDVQLDHMTSERNLFTLQLGADALRLAAMAPRDDALVGVGLDGAVRAWHVDIPHPEVSWRTLFGKVWYEGYPAPSFAWQSSSASDDFEPKLSLVPLMYGTLKATFYALLFAVPLAIFGALYTSQFMRPSLRGIIKPTIEVMAAIPSVVIGFLAALWLAPAVEANTVSYFLSILSLPGMVLVSILLWQRLARRPGLNRVSLGHEFLLIIPMVVIGILLAAVIGPWLELHFFQKSFPQWFYNTTGARYDQRNSIIIALALGFAVIPIIFTIADDSMSNIPKSLTAASLALGASRWQTAWRIVLPSASPGIFAGVMIGFGRAVGETMIVLMATGNTPIIDWSPFNGMRTLSANIAVEIPEAPVDGTLYRVLFLTAVILFVMTFVVNTVAELVRQRLRRKYGQL